MTMADPHQNTKKVLRNTSCPKADFSVHKKELGLVIGMIEVTQEKPWWDVSFARVAGATAIAIGIFAAVFVVTPLSPETSAEVLAGAEAIHQEKGQQGRYYYAKEKLTSAMSSSQETIFLEMREDTVTGNVHTKMYDSEGRVIDEHAVVSEELFVCVECIKEQMLTETMKSGIVLSDMSLDEGREAFAQKLFKRVWSLQENPDKSSRGRLFSQLKDGGEVSYTGKSEWKNVPVEQVEAVEHDENMSFKTKFYFKQGSLAFMGSDDYIERNGQEMHVSSREILDESYTQEAFMFEPGRLQRVVVD